jgi:hypothetical protein
MKLFKKGLYWAWTLLLAALAVAFIALFALTGYLFITATGALWLNVFIGYMMVLLSLLFTSLMFLIAYNAAK